jgi:DHA2 family multidrug resistance protein
MTAATLAAPRPADYVEPRRIVAFFVMILGMFMAILDIQIVAASLSEIQAGLAASADEIAYVQTSYLIAEVVMIPLSGSLSRIMGTRLLFASSAAGFTLASWLCGTATSIEEMVVYRALQGFLGGGMIPTVFAASYTIFPLTKRHVIMPIMGLIVPLAPTIGPTVGGLVTEAFSWHWLFFINIVPGIIVMIASYALIDFDEPDWSLLKNFDWWGLLFMAVFLGSLEYVLEEGASKGWFDDESIRRFAGLAAITGLAFFIRITITSFPIVDLSAFANRNFALGSLFSAVMGVGLFGLTYLFPVYLARVRDFSPLMIGETMFVTGACMFLTAPIAGRMVMKMDPRLMLFLGFAGFAWSTWLMTHVTKDWDFWELLVPQLCRGCSLMFCMVPINNLALGTLPIAKLKNAAGLYNLMRNLGGAIGLAVINTTLNLRFDLHYARMREQITWGSARAEEILATLAQRYGDFAESDLMSLKRVAALVRREAQVMSFADVFLIVTGLFVMMILLLSLMERPAPPDKRS